MQLIETQKSYVQDVVPETYRVYKELKSLRYSVLPSSTVDVQSSEELEAYGKAVIENLHRIIPELKRAKEDIQHEVKVIKKAT